MAPSAFDVWKKLPSRHRGSLRRLWYEAISRVDFGSRLLFMNHGYANPDPAAKPLELAPEEEQDRFAIGLYERVAGAAPWRGQDGLEAGCGRGGGTAWVARRLAPRSLVGVDRTRSAIRFCQGYHRVPGLSFRCADAHELPFPDGSFDRVLNVESSKLYEDPPRFFREVARVLRSGGRFLFADSRKRHRLDELRDQMSRAGLAMLEEEDLSAGVAEALRLDAGRREGLIDEMAPRWLRGTFHRFAHLRDGGHELALFDSGEKVYLRCLLGKRERGGA